ncbi:competence type IV pilus ATPase ComGA [Carnobacterium gallinarum]|uniref:competence type IV pilus ATPase ComGA n=1 Tax=Carnobacterium gallinarum TaxID=2749 RepID=UPI00055483D8|nr:competence type IV pilus ATPase ComGA [Carnobacterium gallinarum]
MAIEELATTILKEADIRGVNDIHILPKSTEYQLFFRVSGQLLLWLTISLEQGIRLIAYFKFLSDMDVGEKRFPQTSSSTMKLDGKAKALRFSTITDFHHQESLVIRLLHQVQKHTLEQTAYFPRQIKELEQLIKRKSGLLLFSGPVGSGKTTTMFQLIKESLVHEERQVFTVEDPVEIEEPRFLQTQVNQKAGISYEALLKASLRHHPDIIVVGEIRDTETAKMVIRGALTGHLVISSIHAKNASGVLSRLGELGISLNQLQQTLIGIVSQKLVPRRCSLCEGTCRLCCTHLSVYEKRSVLYEITTGRQLEKLGRQKEVGVVADHQRGSFNSYLRKAYSYGFITEDGYQKNRLY